MPVALITGITGQDGGYLAEQLVGEGTVVHGLVRRQERIPPNLEDLGGAVRLYEVDLADDEALRSVLGQARPDEVYNLAGMSSVAESWRQPGMAAEINGSFVARLLQLLWEEQERRSGPIRFVQASSAEIFAGTSTVPQDEATALRPGSPYGASKAFAHHLVQVFRGRGLGGSNAILYNHESPRRPTTFVTRKITSSVAAIAEGRASELVLGNLDARRDWGWAPEYVDALVRMARSQDADDYVVASSVSHSVADFVAAAFARVGIADWQGLVRTDPGFVRPSDATELVGNAAKAGEVLGWRPQVPFAEIVGRMVDADLSP